MTRPTHAFSKKIENHAAMVALYFIYYNCRTGLVDTEMKTYVKAILIAGIVIPIFLHMIASESMPWWPDTVSLGIAFGAGAVAMVWKARTDREMNRRLWKALKTLARHLGSN